MTKLNIALCQRIDHVRISHDIQSATSDHLLNCECDRDFDDFTISSKDFNRLHLLIKVSLLIPPENPALNETIKALLNHSN